MTEPNDAVAVPAEVVPGRGLETPYTQPIAPGQAGTVFMAMSEFAANVVGIEVPEGASVDIVRILKDAFIQKPTASVSQQLAEMMPRCPRDAFVFVTLRNNTTEVQAYRAKIWVVNEDRSAVVAAPGKNGKAATGTQPRTTTRVLKGVTVTVTRGPGRRMPNPDAKKKSAKIAAPPPAPGGFERFALDAVLRLLDRNQPIASQMIPMMMTKFGPFKKALDAGDAAILERAIRTRTPLHPTKAAPIAQKLRAAASGTRNDAPAPMAAAAEGSAE